jgi:site-specific DNA recombinase
MARRVYGYARVSGAEQGRTGTSLAGQSEAIERYAAAHGLRAPDIRIEVDSGANESRVELAAVLGELSDGDVVLVTRVDRWSRDIVHAVKTVRDLVARGVRWIAIEDGIDASTPNGASTLGIMAWAADNERQRIRERTVGRRKALRDQGHFVEGLPPIGYARGKKRNLVVVPAEADVVREAYRLCIDGRSLRQIAKTMRLLMPERHKWDHPSLHRVLRNRVYLGQLKTTRGEWIDAHDAIITRSVFERAQRAMQSRRKGGRRASATRTNEWLLRSIASCSKCGARMGPAYGGTRRVGVEINYYACNTRLADRSCSLPYCRVEAHDEAALELLGDQLAALRDELATPSTSGKRKRPSTKRRRGQLMQRRARLIDLAADGHLESADLQTRLDAIDRSLADLDDLDQSRAASDAAESPEARRHALRSIQAIEATLAAAPVPARREILTALAERITLDGEHVIIEWKPLENLVREL